jgi:glycine cleavage system H protein
VDNPTDLRYTNEHEWVKVDGDVATQGVTNYAATHLGDMVYVDLPEVGAQLKQGEAAGALESVKAAADFYSPISGTVVERNENLLDEPGIINSDPFGAGWIVKIKPDNLDELSNLMTPDQYTEFEKSQS